MTQHPDEFKPTPRASLPALPPKLRHRPLDARGYPVPWFVAVIDGAPDFRIVDPEKFTRAVRQRLCFICGQPLGRYLAFPIGPMCAVNRITAEPPSHRECALFAVKVCPFLTLPKAQRREAHLPEDVREAPGNMIRRNPGAVCVWITRSFEAFQATGGILLRLAEPNECLWFTGGRAASRDEALAAIETGLPALHDIAQQDGPEALDVLTRLLADCLQRCLPEPAFQPELAR